MQTVINNGDSGLLVRNELNAMFAELYGAIQLPIKIAGLTGNYTQAIPANSFLLSGAAKLVSGSVSIKMGTTAGGDDLFPLTALSSSLVPAVFQQYFASAGNIYITFTGTGSINIRFDVISNYN